MQFHCQLTDCKALMVERHRLAIYRESINRKDGHDMKSKIQKTVKTIGIAVLCLLLVVILFMSGYSIYHQSRLKHELAPINAQRFGLDTPCSKTGKCFDCKSPDTICCQILITRFSRHKGRISVILVNDELGF